MTGADYLAIVKTKIDFDNPTYTAEEAWKRTAMCACDDLALVKLRLDSAVEELEKIERKPLYIVLDDYADPITAEYKGYDTIEEAMKEAKSRLYDVLEKEGLLATCPEPDNYAELAQKLEDENEVLVENTFGAWHGDMTFIKIAKVSK